MRARPATGVRTRLGGNADHEFIGRLAGEAFREFSQTAASSTLAMVKTGVTLVAEKGERLVGFVIVDFPGQRLAHLSAIAVAYNERGTGVGALLLRGAEHLARQRGAARLELCTADSNVEALELFFKSGFVLRHRRSRYYARGHAACQLVKVI
jgi:ribosomal protein S18 acetylase RimI-like enzyme